jgi:hypothetical protein
MTRVRGASLSQARAWSVRWAQPLASATGSMGANALTYALHATSSSRFRSIASGCRLFAGSRARYKLHSEGTRDAVRG